MASRTTRPAARSSWTRSPTARSAPTSSMLGPVADGGHIVWNSTPGCWGPMITPGDPRRPRGLHAGRGRGRRGRRRDRDPHQGHRGHVATRPRPATTRRWRAASTAIPYCAAVCPGCGAEWPETRLEGIGETAVRCAQLRRRRDAVHVHQRLHARVRRPAARASPCDGERAEEFARDAARAAALPDNSRPEPDPHLRAAATSSASSRACGRSSASSGRRRRPRCPTPTTRATSARSSSARRTRSRSTRRSCSSHKTDGHLDIDAVRAGAILVCPVKLAGGGVYLGDMHAMQGDGEIAGHTADVAGTVTLQVEVVKGLGIDGPVLFPLARGPAVPGQAADARTSARRRWRSPSARA